MTKANETNSVTMQEALASLVPIINEAVHEWMQEQNPEAIRKQVFDTLNAAKNTVAPKLLGFNANSWNGKWEIDYCNGRSGNSALGEYFKSIQAEGIKKFFDELDLSTVKPLSQREIEGIRREYRHALIDKLQREVRYKAEEEAMRMLSLSSIDELVLAIKRTEQLISAQPFLPENP